jgi:hypothetical protein
VAKDPAPRWQLSTARGTFGPIRLGFVSATIGALILVLLSDLGLLLPSTPGSDWLWYRDGVERLFGAAQLYDPRMLAGPFMHTAPPFAGEWNQAPWAVPILAPFALLPQPVDQWIWLAATDAALMAAAWLVRPRWRRADLGVFACVVLLSSPAIAGLLWGNLGALVVLGCALFWIGWERRSDRLMALGIILAGLKVVPAAALAVWAMARARRWQPVAWAMFTTLALATPAILLKGSGVLLDFVHVTLNIEQVTVLNFSPSLLLRAFLPTSMALMAVDVVAIALAAWGLVAVRSPARSYALLLLAAVLTVPNLYDDWLLVPLVGLMVTARGEQTAVGVSNLQQVAASLRRPRVPKPS